MSISLGNAHRYWPVPRWYPGTLSSLGGSIVELNVTTFSRVGWNHPQVLADPGSLIRSASTSPVTRPSALRITPARYIE